MSSSLLNKWIGHKYAIDAKRLGDDSVLAWSNLGYWQSTDDSYVAACQMLATQLAESIDLKSTDRLLDLGCGQGASLKYWLGHYQIQQLTAVELQADCVARIKHYLPEVTSYCHSFLKLKQLPALNSFDAVLCIDAAYHSDLNVLLNAVHPVLNANGRLAFHCLMWSEKWQRCSDWQKQQYRYLLKGADIKRRYVMNQHNLQQSLVRHGFEQVVIHDFSEAVLNGFARYIEKQKVEKTSFDFAQFKIAMTAKLCRKLYKDGLLRYVQVSATKT